jgi:hypothetical protein
MTDQVYHEMPVIRSEALVSTARLERVSSMADQDNVHDAENCRHRIEELEEGWRE